MAEIKSTSRKVYNSAKIEEDSFWMTCNSSIQRCDQCVLLSNEPRLHFSTAHTKSPPASSLWELDDLFLMQNQFYIVFFALSLARVEQKLLIVTSLNDRVNSCDAYRRGAMLDKELKKLELREREEAVRRSEAVRRPDSVIPAGKMRQ